MSLTRALAGFQAVGLAPRLHLKPCNIMSDERGDVRVTDFGLAGQKLLSGSLVED